MIDYAGYISEYHHKDKIVRIREKYTRNQVSAHHWYTLYSNLPPERRIQNFLQEDYEIQALAEYLVSLDNAV